MSARTTKINVICHSSNIISLVLYKSVKIRMARLTLLIVILYPDTILCFSYCRNHCWVSFSGWSVANNEAFGLLSTPHSKLVLVFSYKKLIKKRVTLTCLLCLILMIFRI